MSKYCSEIVEKICELIEKDSYTDKEICQNVGISQETFITWKRDKPEFSESIKMAERVYLNMIATEARKSLVKKIQGYTVQEKRTVYNNEVKDGQSKPKIKEQIITDKHYQPDTVAIIFALCNQDSENFKNKQSTELTGKDGSPLIPPQVIFQDISEK